MAPKARSSCTGEIITNPGLDGAIPAPGERADDAEASRPRGGSRRVLGRRLVEDHAVLAGPLGGVERFVGFEEEIPGALGVVRVDGPQDRR
jgi:hypothetical protein